MSLEACPACGYALSVLDHRCRRCATASRALPPFDAKYLPQMIAVVVALGVCLYLIFFH